MQKFLALWKKLIVSYHPSFPLGRSLTMSLPSRTATASLSRWFAVSALVAKLCPRCRVQRSLYTWYPLIHDESVSVITLAVTTTVQKFLAWRRKLIVFAYHPSFPLGRSLTTSLPSRTATASLSRGFVVSALVTKLCPRCRVQRSLYTWYLLIHDESISVITLAIFTWHAPHVPQLLKAYSRRCQSPKPRGLSQFTTSITPIWIFRKGSGEMWWVKHWIDSTCSLLFQTFLSLLVILCNLVVH